MAPIIFKDEKSFDDYIRQVAQTVVKDALEHQRRVTTERLGLNPSAMPALTMLGNLTFSQNASLIGYNSDNSYFIFQARDNGVGLVEVARLQSAADPYFAIGSNGNAMVGTNSGKIGFFGVAPVDQQAHIIDADGTLADITTKFNTLLSELETEGLLADS